MSEPKSTSPGLEVFKATSTFISSVIIAFAGIYVTQKYNSQQLLISKEQVNSQILIARNRELSQLIPNLGADSPTVRKFSAISLALYGVYAVPGLVATLDDENVDVRTATIKSLATIGPDAAPALKEIFLDERNNRNQRSSAIVALSYMRAPGTYEIALAALKKSGEDPIVRKDAVTAIGILKDKRAVEELRAVLVNAKRKDVALIQNSLWALGEIHPDNPPSEILALLKHPDEEVRFQAVWAIGKIGDKNQAGFLAQVELSDPSERVRTAAKDAQAWTELRQ